MITSGRRHGVFFHVTEDIRQKLIEGAREHGLSVSGYVYLLVCRALGAEAK